jgi:Transcription factor TFIIH complex subunit Tfb5
MVNVEKGLFVTADPAMQQFLKHLDQEGAIQHSGSFIVRELDERHLLIDPRVRTQLDQKIDDLMDSLTPEVGKE